MKKFCIILTVLCIISISGVGCYTDNSTAEQYLRIHIRAHSNTEQDQAVKLEVCKSVVEFLTPLVAECNSKQQAKRMLSDNLSNIESVCNFTLAKQGYSYTASAGLKTESFPTRVYASITLESGFYDALIINLGSGSGENWWCVVYPPLCFTESSAGYIYKSKIYCIINDFFNKRGEKI